MAQGAEQGIIAQTLCYVRPHNGPHSAGTLLVSNLAGRAHVQSISIILPFCIVLITQFLTQPLAFLFSPHYNSAFLKSYSATLKKKKTSNSLPFQRTSVIFFPRLNQGDFYKEFTILDCIDGSRAGGQGALLGLYLYIH